MDKLELNVSWAALWKILFFLVFAAVLFMGRKIILALFLAIAVSSGLEFVIAFLERRKIPRTLAVILVFLVGALLVTATIYLIIPFAIADLITVFSGFQGTPLGEWLSPFLDPNAPQSLGAWAMKISKALFSQDVSLGAFSGILGGLGLAVAIIAVAFYLCLSKNGVERFLRTIVPEKKEEEFLRIYNRSIEKISFWFRTQITISFIVGLLVWASLFLLGVRHAFLLGLLAGIFEIVPFVGPILAGGAALLFAFVSSPSLAFYTLLVFLAIQQLEAHVLVPLITKRAVGLHPVIVIISLLIGIEAAGLLGALVAVPAAAVFQEIVEDRSDRRAAARMQSA